MFDFWVFDFSVNIIWTRGRSENFRVNRTDAHSEVPTWMQDMDVAAAVAEEHVLQLPKRSSKMGGSANSMEKAKSAAASLKDKADETRPRHSQRGADSVSELSMTHDMTTDLRARLVLRTSLGGVYEDDSTRYTKLSVPESHVLVLDGQREMIIPHGEIQVCTPTTIY